ncbi:uncharacterized protein LOC142776980 [Rhipicephalus microplus]|uniref:uncharacterized protein LOC142776980 n=1 Tax=Rhipicephalus microplus TaxID=6941 RepID=UPI003F6CDAE5
MGTCPDRTTNFRYTCTEGRDEVPVPGGAQPFHHEPDEWATQALTYHTKKPLLAIHPEAMTGEYRTWDKARVGRCAQVTHPSPECPASTSRNRRGCPCSKA